MPYAAPGHLGIVVAEQGTTSTIALRGEWDLAKQDATRQAIANALTRCPECVVLDLSELTFIDSSAIHVLLDLHKRTTEQNVRLVIVPGPRAVQRLFEIVQLTPALPFLTGDSSRAGGR
jgi:anti-anti-sigma factor